ncbi:MAG: TIGR02147 family protein [Bdellovibrionota bacterium]
MKSIFEFKSYKKYLIERVGDRRQRSGIKGEMAKALRVQPTYVSQFVYGTANLSLEHAEVLNGFLGHSREEGEFFFLLVQLERAGTPALRRYFSEKIEESLKRRLVLTERLGTSNELSEVDQSRYYSTWRFLAVHIAVTIPALQTRESIAGFLKLPLAVVSETVEFLVKCGMVLENGGRLTTGTTFIRLGNQSHNILKHHSNWRTQAVESLDREKITELHYSAVMSVSKEDVLRLKNSMLDFIKENAEIIRASKEEELYCYTMDFFSLGK